MTSIKLLLSFSLLTFCMASCQSQTATSSIKQTTDTMVYANAQAFRQAFWDSLPRPVGWTNDYERLFSDREGQKLDSIILAFEKETSTQICIVTLDTIYTSNAKFDELALHIAKSWE